MATAGTLEYIISVDSSKLSSGLNSAESKVKGFGDKVSAWSIAKGKLLGDFIKKAGQVTIGFVKDSISEGMSFDKAMSQVAATLGKSTEEVGELSKFARKMGAETAFSATEAAEALNYMALAGYDAQTSIKMLPTVLDLAAAGNIDLARASDMVTDAQSALGLSIEETEDLVDQMARTSSKTNTSVEQLGDAILTVGGTAKMLRGGTVELNAALGVLADNGIKGSEGGTALRNVLLSLTAPTDKAAKKLKQLGIEVFDADGNMRDLPSIMADINEATKDMTQQQRTEFLSDVFNKRDLKAVEALLGTTQKKWNGLYNEIAKSKGAAKQMAETQLDNLAGDVTKFKSALSEAKLTIAEGLTPTLRKFVQKATGWVQLLSKAFSKDGFSGLVKELGSILNETIDSLKKSDSPVLQKLGGALETVKNVGKFVYDLFTDFPGTVEKLKSSDSEILQLVGEGLSTISELASAIKTAFTDGIPAAIEQLKSSDDPLANLVGGGLQALYDVCKFFIDNVGLEGTIKGIAFAFGLFKTIQISSTFLTFLSKLTTLANAKNLSQLSTLLQNNGNNVVPAGEPTPTTSGTTVVPTKTSALGKLKNAANNVTALGLTAAVMFLPALLGIAAAELTPDEYKIGSEARLHTAEYTAEDVANLREWVELKNREKEIEEEFLTTGNYDEEEHDRVINRLKELDDVLKTDLGNKFMDYLVANDINPEFDQIPTELLDWFENGLQVKIEPDASGANADIVQQIGVVRVPARLDYLGGGGGQVRSEYNAKGEWDVPYDEYLTRLHRNEMVLSASQARRYRNGEGEGNAELIAAVRGLRNDMQNMKLVVGKKVFGRAVVNYGGSRMSGYIGGADSRREAGYGT